MKVRNETQQIHLGLMKQPPSFRRFLLIMVFLLEGLSLAVVIGFLFVMLDRSMKQEQVSRINVQLAELRLHLNNRLNYISLNGVICVDSVIDKGSTFNIDLPARINYSRRQRLTKRALGEYHENYQTSQPSGL